ncbi:hypothetical protein RZO55_09990, partial [Clostridium boliviensis]
MLLGGPPYLSHSSRTEEKRETSPTPADSGGSKWEEKAGEEKREERKAATSPAPITAPKELAGDREDRSPSRQS